MAWAAECEPDRVSVRGPWGQAAFTIEVADDPRERAKGLMFREALPTTHGMLFLFEQPQQVGFWMKDTLIPLDMIFVQEDGTVSRVHHNAIPHDTTLIDGGAGVRAVLEVNGGIAARFGIDEGSELQHPAFDQADAAWPCAPVAPTE
ncbi:DUF192 domain-containing protein [Aliiroseovarius sp. F20344]|uniref:DUF192 domain-containing protein n=1 Tax=Aliiroseovarius sp. F20344 TaxID=2926414 RepID=UPI001FF37E2C|nr:DUF192 domain-containing protein [Aliiroseovarius sp. F20344]MCK0143843.1 DUF192 domain-containing protein [Aliiroseovarius sp. F20344]